MTRAHRAKGRRQLQKFLYAAASLALDIELVNEFLGQRAMTPREELIQAIQMSPDDVILTLLETIRKLAHRRKDIDDQAIDNRSEKRVSGERLYRKNGVLVAETGRLDDFDLNEFIKEIREERMQKFVDQAGL